MPTAFFTKPAVRLRLMVSRFFNRFGFGEESFLLILAVLVGVVTAFAAVGFHELIVFIRNLLYLRAGADYLYGPGLWLLILYPAAGGLVVGIIGHVLLRGVEGHGIVDVMESVIRTSGFQRPIIAVEKILTSGITIGSGGSAGAEGPIVQIGAAIASGVGQFFGLARQQMPLLTGCGCAAGISAIFNAPFGGVLFTLEVILQDFSLRTFTPIVVASVIAQVTTLAIFEHLAFYGHSHEQYQAIFAMPQQYILTNSVLNWGQVGNFVLLGLVCGFAGLALTRMMYYSERLFRRRTIPKPLLPAVGGALLGIAGVVYVLLFGHLLLHKLKPFDYASYPPPAFFGDGYGVIEQILATSFPAYGPHAGRLIMLLVFLCGIKIVATCLTLSSGGSGGVIARSLFIGATAGAVVGIVLKSSGHFSNIHPEFYALVGMGAVLAAVVHAPLASILIVFELTQDYKVMLPAMLACVVAASTARVLFPDSIYTLGLRRRGLRIGGPSDFNLLRRLSVEMVPLEPAIIVHRGEPFQRILDLSAAKGTGDFVVTNGDGAYVGMIVSDDVTFALLERDAIPLLTCGDLVRTDLPLVKTSDDLGTALETFARHDVGQLPVVVSSSPNHVVGVLTRAALMRRYQKELSAER